MRKIAHGSGLLERSIGWLRSVVSHPRRPHGGWSAFFVHRERAIPSLLGHGTADRGVKLAGQVRHLLG